jgi:uncharacterized protein YegL
MSQPEKFITLAARPLPVILLVDASGSMAEGGKIAALNQAVRDMLAAFSSSDDLRAEIHVAILTFGGVARVHTPLQPASAVRWADIQAGGGTPMGSAMTLAAELIDDREQVPARAYRPTVVLVSDGQPTDDWTAGLKRLTQQGRAQKADRMALAIGADADVEMLRRFLVDEKKQVFVAADARRIREFFAFVTMTMTARGRSATPNDIPSLQSPFDLDQR